jgi:hypothetical protein
MEDDEKSREILRAMTPEQKLNTAMRLYWSARELKTAALRSQHPDWSEEKIAQEVRHAFLTARG